MAYLKGLFPTSGPEKGSMLRLIPATLITLFVLGMFYPFVSGYVHARFGKQEDRSALIGQWVGLVQLQPLEGQHQPPSEEHGAAIMTITFKPTIWSYLSKLQGTAEMTDYEYHVKGMETSGFMTPFNPQEGHFSVGTEGTKSDDALTGILECKFNKDTLTIAELQTPQFYITGILRRGDDASYQQRVNEMKNMPTTPTQGGMHGR
jgi:hypothetical protein